MTTPATRLHLRRPLTDLGFALEEFGPFGSPEEMAPLMLASYRGTPDDEGETLEDTVEVLAGAMRGAFGPWLPDASFVSRDGGKRVGAAFTAMDGAEPFIAFLFTLPEASGRGVATRLVTRVCQALATTGHDHVSLWVNVANARAVGLYRHLGFVDVP
ncbi:GNAT family N-acetyltransferase [Cellulomonas xiejunii]|uniref:GNAT family N-acetyltransferase n=1 Tax=Cellulomonas xiejunii TaxID=2968083 RepID=UPI001D0F26EC|nr:GNAT family N-acetyltransferase [Cellulomonas xiejunii]MCC2315607.1 GNAT family N-acetyltransferase [Cellulomonas xiejunii]